MYSYVSWIRNYFVTLPALIKHVSGGKSAAVDYNAPPIIGGALSDDAV